VKLVLVLNCLLQLSAGDKFYPEAGRHFFLACLLMLAGRKREVSVGARQMSVVRLNTAFQCGNNIAFIGGHELCHN